MRRIGFSFLVLVHSVCAAQTGWRGLVWEDDYYNTLPLKASYFNPVDLWPSTYSLKSYCPSVITQSNTNTGVAWSGVWYARTILEAGIQGWQDTPTITRNAFSPIFNYRSCAETKDCDQPIKLSSLLFSMEQEGGLPYSEYQAYCYDSVSPSKTAAARNNRMPGFVRLFNTSDKKETKLRAIREALVHNHPVVIGIICSPSFALAKEFWQPREEPNRDFGGHAVCIVGYDNTKFGGALEVVNSWGKSWAMGGFTWLRYEDVERYVEYGYELIGTGVEPLDANVVLTLRDGKNMPVKFRNPGYYAIIKPYATGTQFQLGVQSSRDIFYYAIAFDEQRNFELLFPSDKSLYPWLSGTHRQLVLPDGTRPITLTEPAGKNYVLMIFSGREIVKEDLLKQLQEKSGELGASFQTVNANSAAKWSTDKISVQSAFNSNTLLSLVIEIDQVH